MLGVRLPRKGGPAPFAPPAGVAQWLRSSDLALAEGAAIDPWPDQSGSGSDAVGMMLTGVAGNKIARPTYRAGEISGFAAARFNGAYDIQGQPAIGRVHSNNPIAGNPSFSFALVMEWRAGPVNIGGVLCCGSDGDTGWNLSRRATGHIALRLGAVGLGSLYLGDGLPATQIAANIPFLVSCRRRSADNYNEIRINGALAASVVRAMSAASDDITALALGAFYAYNFVPDGLTGACNYTADFNLAEMFYYPSYLADADISKIENYLLTRYGL